MNLNSASKVNLSGTSKSSEKRIIHLLDEATINKIAAGEVIERPASVVKELVENSLDSGASSVKIDIGSDSAGIFRIRIIDDGCGMDRESAVLSLKRHATSKISDASDLMSIGTMGFRGEALASIAAVSKMTMITKERGSEIGTKLIVEGGNVLDVLDTGAPDGTTVLVENLFFNTPARKKFMKSRQTEFSHIYSVIEGAALANKEVSFTLSHNGKNKLDTLKSESLAETVSYIYGKSACDDMCVLKSSGTFMKIDGLCSIQSMNYPISKQILVSVNRRPVISPAVIRAVKRGYGTLLPKDRYPAAFLNITIDKNVVDVNVHPSKREVKISREKELSDEIASAVRNALEVENLKRTGPESCTSDAVSSEKKSQSSPVQSSLFGGAASSVPVSGGSFGASVVSSHQTGYSGSAGAGLDSKSGSSFISGAALFGIDTLNIDSSLEGYHPRFTTTDSQLRLTENFEYSDSDKVMLPPMEIIGQYDNAYIIARMKNNDSDELVIIDQHAAHERILYDQVEKLRKSGRKSQELLVPAVIELKPKEAAVLLQNLEFFESEGFVIEEFGTDTFAVRSVPMILGKRVGTEVLSDIIADLMDGTVKTYEEKKEKITSTVACRAAIKAGAVLTMEQMERLINQLSRTELPYTCPHGRPTMIVYSRSKLDSLFLRS